MKIGDKIKSIRKKKEITQTELALKSGVSRSYLADVEANRYNPSISTLEKLANALNINLSELLSDNYVADCEDSEINYLLKTVNKKKKQKLLKLMKTYLEDENE